MESWNSVMAYGPQIEIDRLKALCIVAGEDGKSTIAFDRVIADPEDSRVDNFRETETPPGMYAFTFDTRWHFPFDVFNELAEQFPTIAFDCNAIHENDEWCGFGWFNPPEGGEAFADCYAVPDGYWDHNMKRDPDAHRRYLEVVARLTAKRPTPGRPTSNWMRRSRPASSTRRRSR